MILHLIALQAARFRIVEETPIVDRDVGSPANRPLLRTGSRPLLEDKAASAQSFCVFELTILH